MVLGLVASLVLSGQSSVNLVYKPPLHKTLKYRMVMDMKQDMGASGNFGSKTQMDMELTATSRKGDVTTLLTKITDAKVTTPPGSPMAGMSSQMEKSMKGKSYTSSIDSHFKPLTIGGSEVAGMSGQGMADAMHSFTFPSRPVKVGQTWTSKMDMGKMMASVAKGMKVTSNVPIVCRLVSVQGNLATISMTMKGAMNMDMGAQKFTTDLDSKGSMVVELGSGVVRSEQNVMDSTSNIGTTKFKQHMVQTMKLR